MKILVVDDDKHILEYIKRIFEIFGFHIKVIEAMNGKEAVELAQKHFPNLIIMDIEMPVMDGMKALKILKSESLTSEIPVIACTGRAFAEDKERFLHEGFNGFISKPFRITDFMDEVTQFIQE